MAVSDQFKAVIDIGSNTVRLVVFDGAAGLPWTVFNERALCGLGRGVAVDGAMAEQDMDLAIKALLRFTALTRAMPIAALRAVATAAVREASNGASFIARISEECGLDVRVLSGRQEAALVAHGVARAIPNVDGLVGDLGGGSLELVEIENGEAVNGTTLPIGSLRLMRAQDEGRPTLISMIDDSLGEIDWLGRIEGRGLYIVGGGWRAIGRVHMAHTGYPVHILHGYEVPAGELKTFAGALSRMSAQTLNDMQAISEGRANALSAVSQALLGLLQHAKPDRIVFSGTGLREGLFLRELAGEESGLEPDLLLRGTRAMAMRDARFPETLTLMDDWLASALGAGDAAARRLRAAAVWLSDAQWRASPDERAHAAFFDTVSAPWLGISHPDRLELAFAVYSRYRKHPPDGEIEQALAYLSAERLDRARACGAGLRLAHTLSGGNGAILADTRLRVRSGGLVLSVAAAAAPLISDSVRRRIADLAKVLDLRAEPIEIADAD